MMQVHKNIRCYRWIDAHVNNILSICLSSTEKVPTYKVIITKKVVKIFYVEPNAYISVESIAMNYLTSMAAHILNVRLLSRNPAINEIRIKISP